MAASDNLQPRQFFHGSKAKLEVGDELRPAPAPRFRDVVPNRVYFSEHPWVAQNYAGNVAGLTEGHGHLYEVEPVGRVFHDPAAVGQGRRGTSHMAKSARVTRRLEPDEALQALGYGKRAIK